MKNKEVAVDPSRVATKAGRLLVMPSDDPKAEAANKAEIAACPFVSVQLTHEVMDRKGVKRDIYSAKVMFDQYLTHISIPLDQDGAQFGTVMVDEGKTWIPNQVTVQRRVRPLITRFPEHDGLAASERRCIELFLSDRICLTVDLTGPDKKYRDWLPLFERNVANIAELGKYAWFVRVAAPAEKPEDLAPAASEDQQ